MDHVLPNQHLPASDLERYPRSAHSGKVIIE